MSEYTIRVRRYTSPTAPAEVIRGASAEFGVGKDEAATLTLTVSERIAGSLPTPFYAGVEVRNGSRWVKPRNDLFVFHKRGGDAKDASKVKQLVGVLYVADRAAQQKLDPAAFGAADIKWPGATPGAVMADILTRLPATGIARNFTPAVDSAGGAWLPTDLADHTAPRLASIKSVLDAMTASAFCTWWSEGTQLVLRLPTVGEYRPNIDFTSPANSVRVDEDTAETASKFYIETDTDVGTQVETRPELGAGPREAIVTVAGATTADIARRMAMPLIDAASKKRIQIVVSIDAAKLPARPFVDFNVGDDFDIHGGRYRLVHMQVSKGEATKVQLTFGEIFRDLVARLAGRTASLTIGGQGNTVGAPLPATGSAPAAKPAIPTAPTLMSDLGQVVVTWDGLLVTGKPPASVVGVVAEAAPAPSGPFTRVTPDFGKGPMPFAPALVEVPTGGTVHVRLRALNTKNVLSEPSAVATVVVQAIGAPDIDGAVMGAIQAAAVAANAAQNTADGKTTISPNAPTLADGNGKPAGALWWRKTGLTVDALWEWSGGPGGSWISRKYAEAVLGQVNIGTGTYGELDGVRLTAASIATPQLLVGNYTNLLDNPQFRQGLKGWQSGGSGTWSVGDVGGSWRYCAQVNVTGSWVTLGGPRITCDPGDEFYVSAGIYDPAAGAGGAAQVMVYFRDADGNDIESHAVQQTAASTWSTVSRSVKAPSGTKTAQMLLNVAGRGSGTVTFGLPQMVRKVDANLVVDGGIYARHLQATEIWADAGFFNQARANVLSVGALTGITITGSVVRTAASGKRVQLDTVGLRAYNDSNLLTASLTADNGGLVLSGPLSTAMGGSRAILNGNRLNFYNDLGQPSGWFGDDGNGGLAVRMASPANSRRITVSDVFGIEMSGDVHIGGLYVFDWSGSSSRLVRDGGGYLDLGYDSTSGYLRSLDLYDRTYTAAANLHVTGTGTLGRATSLKSAKLDVETQDIPDPLAVLNITPRTWTDRGSVERAVAEGYDDPDKRVRPFGAVVEEVLPYAPYVVMRDLDGAPDGLAYDRLAIALIPALRNFAERISALEGAPAPEWATPPVYDDTATWAAIKGAA